MTPTLSSILILTLFCFTIRSYSFLNSEFGVAGTKITDSSPLFLNQLSLFLLFCSMRDFLSHDLGLYMGSWPLSSLSFIFWYALVADWVTIVRNWWLYPEYCILQFSSYLQNLCPHAWIL